MKIECEIYLDYPDTYKPRYPKKNENIEKFYIDQSGKSVLISDRRISSNYTWWGIHQMDTWFADQIRLENPDKEKLDKMIRRNPHLHNVIKTNLLRNLKRKNV